MFLSIKLKKSQNIQNKKIHGSVTLDLTQYIKLLWESNMAVVIKYYKTSHFLNAFKAK